MNPQRTVQATWFTMLVLQSIGSIDAKRKLPAPKQYVAINVLWGILFLMADTGFGRLAARLSMLVLLTASVAGPFGQKLVDWLKMIAKYFATPPQGNASLDTIPNPSAPSGLVSN